MQRLLGGGDHLILFKNLDLVRLNRVAMVLESAKSKFLRYQVLPFFFCSIVEPYYMQLVH